VSDRQATDRHLPCADAQLTAAYGERPGRGLGARGGSPSGASRRVFFTSGPPPFTRKRERRQVPASSPQLFDGHRGPRQRDVIRRAAYHVCDACASFDVGPERAPNAHLSAVTRVDLGLT
jgi:hypothetical protein